MNRLSEKYYGRFQSYEEYIEYLLHLDGKHSAYFYEEETWFYTYEEDGEELEFYIKEFPEGRYIREAKEYLEKLVWDIAQLQNTTASYEAYLAEYPNGRYANDAKAKLDVVIKHEREDELAWKNAKEQNTREAYEEYLLQYPKGKYITDAEINIVRIIEEARIWIVAQRVKTKKAYEEYLKKYPNGEFVKLAKNKIDEIKKQQRKDELAWKNAKKEDTKEAYRNYLSKFPKGKYSEEATNKINEFIKKEKDKYFASKNAKNNNTRKSYESILGDEFFSTDRFLIGLICMYFIIGFIFNYPNDVWYVSIGELLFTACIGIGASMIPVLFPFVAIDALYFKIFKKHLMRKQVRTKVARILYLLVGIPLGAILVSNMNYG